MNNPTEIEFEQNYAWPVHCFFCRRKCPVDINHKLHKNRKYCPLCFAKENQGRLQINQAKDWQGQCDWKFLKSVNTVLYNTHFDNYKQEKMTPEQSKTQISTNKKKRQKTNATTARVASPHKKKKTKRRSESSVSNLDEEESNTMTGSEDEVITEESTNPAEDENKEYLDLIPRPCQNYEKDKVKETLCSQGYVIIKTYAPEMADVLCLIGLMGKQFIDMNEKELIHGAMSYNNFDKCTELIPEEKRKILQA